MTKKTIAIAIDGPAGAGKSTIARAVAKKHGYIYVDTGALYRAIGYSVISQGKTASDPEQVVPALENMRVTLRFIDAAQRVFVNDEDVTDKIRTPAVSMAASDVSAIPQVRTFLFDLQKDIARSNNVVMDGRDIGTVVLPNAQLKIFLTATPQERARRRYEELLEKGGEIRYEDVLQDVITRDYNDSHRAVAPLKQAPDAILVDTTGSTLEESIQRINAIVKERLD